MKRFLCLLFVLILIPLFAFADLPDISELSNEELLALSYDINLRLFSKELFNGVTVPQGRYIIGEDIPSGVYRIEITGGSGYYDLREKPDGHIISSGITGKSYKVTDIGKIELSDGNELYICNSTFIFYPYTGLFN